MQSYQKNKGSGNEDIELQFVGIEFHNIKKCLYFRKFQNTTICNFCRVGSFREEFTKKFTPCWVVLFG